MIMICKWCGAVGLPIEQVPADWSLNGSLKLKELSPVALAGPTHAPENFHEHSGGSMICSTVRGQVAQHNKSRASLFPFLKGHKVPTRTGFE